MSAPDADRPALSQEALEELRMQAEECKRRALDELARIERLIAEGKIKVVKDESRFETEQNRTESRPFA